MEVDVGDGQRPAGAVAGWAGVGAGALRADSELLPVESADTSTARRDSFDGKPSKPTDDTFWFLAKAMTRKGNTFHFDGQLPVDMDVFVHTPVDCKPETGEFSHVNQPYVRHTGDDLKLLTTDHSFVRRLQDAGQLTEAEAAIHPQRNMLYKAVGQGDDLDIDTFTKTLPEQGKLILCSDGLWGLVPDERIAEILNRDIPPTAMTDELVTMARAAGGHDNITAIVVEFRF